MSRKKAGTIVKTKTGLFQAVITLADGSRKRMPPFAKGTSKALARDRAMRYSEQLHDVTLPPPKPAAVIKPKDSHEPWFATWCADREARGYTTVSDSKGH